LDQGGEVGMLIVEKIVEEL